MYIERLGLRHFRLYSQQTFTFSPHFNLIEGPNARGKTALLEAIYLAAVGSSFRTHRSVDLIRHDSAGFTVDILYYHGTVEQHIRIALTPDERCVYINGTRNSSLSSVLGGMKATVLTPDDCALIKGAPQLRRHYLDLQLGQVDPLYNHHLKRYARALKQRNCLLKMGSAATLDSWEYELAHAASYIILKRAAVVKTLSTRVERLYCLLSGRSAKLELNYRCGSTIYTSEWTQIQCQEQLYNRWRSTRNRDGIVGNTLSGPHRDDLLLVLDGLELRHYGSEGEKRTGAAALRLAEWEQIAASCQDERPILLVDDLGLGLDPQRQANFLDYLATADQVFITTAQPFLWEPKGREIKRISL